MSVMEFKDLVPEIGKVLGVTFERVDPISLRATHPEAGWVLTVFPEQKMLILENVPSDTILETELTKVEIRTIEMTGVEIILFQGEDQVMFINANAQLPMWRGGKVRFIPVPPEAIMLLRQQLAEVTGK